MASDSIRIKVQLNSNAKFVLRAEKNAQLSDVKRSISGVLKSHFKIYLSTFSLLTEDGFEVLDFYKVCDMLEDGQLVTIDPFSASSVKRGRHSRDNVDTSHETKIENHKEDRKDLYLRDQRKDYDSPVNNAKEKISSAPAIDICLEPMAVEIKTEKRKISSVEIPKSVIKKVESEAITASNASQKSKPQKTVIPDLKSENQANEATPKPIRFEDQPLPALPPKPDNFKGFVVKKNDVKKGQNSVTEISSFKPLKKRKVEEMPATDLNLDDF